MQKNWVGIQIAPISFLDEGVEQVLDILQEKGSVNALVLMALSWSQGAAGRTEQSFIDHGVLEPHSLQGGAFWNPDPKYYEKTSIRQFRSPDPLLSEFDVFEAVVPAARKRGMKVYGYNWETGRGDKPTNVPGFAQVVEVDAYGRKAPGPCFNNPNYKEWIFSVTEEWCQRYDVDGVDWGIERQGPLTMSVIYGQAATCFCTHCRERAYWQGIDVERAREGYLKIQDYLKGVGAGEEPRDGYFVTFLRLLLNYPEVLQWEKFWVDSQKALYREIHGLVKFLDPEKEMGLGILQWINSFNPYLRAQHDYEELKGVCDWVKPVLYNVPAGIRFKTLVENLQAKVLKDATADECASGLYKLLHLDEIPWSELASRGFSPDYVRRETARLAQALAGEAKVYPGIGAGVPSPNKRIEPEDVRAAIQAAYEGGADGILLARSYADTTLKNLEAAGQVFKELGKA